MVRIRLVFFTDLSACFRPGTDVPGSGRMPVLLRCTWETYEARIARRGSVELTLIHLALRFVKTSCVLILAAYVGVNSRARREGYKKILVAQIIFAKESQIQTCDKPQKSSSYVCLICKRIKTPRAWDPRLDAEHPEPYQFNCTVFG